MGRLLDMEEIIKFAKTTYPTEDVKKITWLLCHTPTAYDVEKVVEEILAQFGCKDCEYADETDKHACIMCCEKEVLDDICNIVRKGGVE